MRAFRPSNRVVPIRSDRRWHRRRPPTATRNASGLRLIVLAGVLGTMVGIVPNMAGPLVASSQSEPLSACFVTDGDTLRCGGERIRLLGIDAPELAGHCRPGRQCVEGDPIDASRSLAEALRGALHIRRVRVDHYGRTLATIDSAVGDLSCWQLAHGQAAYRGDWDDGLHVARACPRVVLGIG
jgi:endonuclease YncB( thermonuclease family)